MKLMVSIFNFAIITIVLLIFLIIVPHMIRNKLDSNATITITTPSQKEQDEFQTFFKQTTSTTKDDQMEMPVYDMMIYQKKEPTIKVWQLFMPSPEEMKESPLKDPNYEPFD